MPDPESPTLHLAVNGGQPARLNPNGCSAEITSQGYLPRLLADIAGDCPGRVIHGAEHVGGQLYGHLPLRYQALQADHVQLAAAHPVELRFCQFVRTVIHVVFPSWMSR